MTIPTAPRYLDVPDVAAELVSSSPQTIWSRTRRVLPVILFPLVLWACSTLMLGGTTGKYLDDYSINLRDPVTNALPEYWSLWSAYPFFWRPAHIAMCFGAGTFLWDHDRLIDVFCAVMHALAAISVWNFARLITRSPIAPVMAGLIVLTAPYTSEVVFWFCTTSTAISTSLLFLLLAWTVYFARSGNQPRRGWGWIPLMTALSFMIPCLFEQPAAGAAMIPLVYLGCCPEAEPWRIRLRRAGVATACCGLACVVYVALMIDTIPPKFRGGTASFVTGERVGARAAEMLSALGKFIYGNLAQQVHASALETGLKALWTPQGLVWIAFAVSTAAIFGRWWMSASRSTAPVSQAQRGVRAPVARWPYLILAAALLQVLLWVPVLVIDRQVVEFRLWYAPLAALGILTALIAERVLQISRGHVRKGVCALMLAIVVSLGVAGSVCMVGFQYRSATRFAMDQTQLRSLARLVPEPPLGACFMPMELRSSPTTTGRPLFDLTQLGVFEAPWTAHAMIQRTFHRLDVTATSWSPWARYGLEHAQLRGLPFPACEGQPLAKFNPPALHRWDRVVPFVVEADNSVRLVRRIVVERPGGDDLDVRPKAVADAIARTNAPSILLRAASAQASPGTIVIDPDGGSWSRGSLQEPAVVHSIEAFGIRRRALVLDPQSVDPTWSTLRLRIPHRAVAMNLVLRICIPASELEKHSGSGRCAVEVTFPAAAISPTPPNQAAESGMESAHQTLVIDRQLMLKERRWLPLILPLQAGPEAEVRVRIRPARHDEHARRESGIHQADPLNQLMHEPVWVSSGVLAPRAADRPQPASNVR